MNLYGGWRSGFVGAIVLTNIGSNDFDEDPVRKARL